MRKKSGWLFPFIRTTIFAILLMTLGLILGFRYANEGSLFGQKISFFENLAKKTKTNNLSSLISSSNGKSTVSMDTF